MRSAPLVLLLGAVLGSTFAPRGAAAQTVPERAESQPRSEAPSTERDVAARDTPLNPAAAVPAAGTVRVTAQGGADRSSTNGGLGGVFGAGVLWSIASGVATEVGVTAHGRGAYPDVGLRWQGLRQETAGIDLTTAVRYGSFGTELRTTSGGAAGAQLAIGRSFGRLQLLGNAMIARGVIARSDVDAFGGAAALVQVLQDWRIGLDARVRTEVEDTYKTEEDVGRAVEIKGGLVSAHRYGPAYIQIFGGWQIPRGLAAPGPAVLANATFDF